MANEMTENLNMQEHYPLWLGDDWYIPVDAEGRCIGHYGEDTTGFIIQLLSTSRRGGVMALKIPRMVAETHRENAYISELLLHERDTVQRIFTSDGSERGIAGLLPAQSTFNPLRAPLTIHELRNEARDWQNALIFVRYEKEQPPYFCLVNPDGVKTYPPQAKAPRLTRAQFYEIKEKSVGLGLGAMARDWSELVFVTQLDHQDKKENLGIAESNDLVSFNITEALSPYPIANSITWYTCVPSIAYPWAPNTLQEAIGLGSRGVTWSLEQHLQLVENICNGIRVLHTKGMLHTDIRPANIVNLGNPRDPERYYLANYGRFAASNIFPFQGLGAEPSGQSIIGPVVEGERTQAFYAPERQIGHQRETADMAIVIPLRNSESYHILVGWKSEFKALNLLDASFQPVITADEYLDFIQQRRELQSHKKVRNNLLDRGDRIQLRDYVFELVAQEEILNNIYLFECHVIFWTIYHNKILINENKPFRDCYAFPIPYIIELPQWSAATDIYSLGVLCLYSLYTDSRNGSTTNTPDNEFEAMLTYLTDQSFFNAIWPRLEWLRTQLEERLSEPGRWTAEKLANARFRPNPRFVNQNSINLLQNRAREGITRPTLKNEAIEVVSQFSSTIPGIERLLWPLSEGSEVTAEHRYELGSFIFFMHFVLRCLHRQENLDENNRKWTVERWMTLPFCQDRHESPHGGVMDLVRARLQQIRMLIMNGALKGLWSNQIARFDLRPENEIRAELQKLSVQLLNFKTLQYVHDWDLSILQEAFASAKERGDRHAESVLLGNWGVNLANLGQHQFAIAYFQQALIIARELSDQRTEAGHLSNLAGVYTQLGQLDVAAQYNTNALHIMRELRDYRGEGDQLAELGKIYLGLGKLPEAISYYEQALQIAQISDDQRYIPDYLWNLATAHQRLAQTEQAFGYFAQRVDLLRETEPGEAAETLLAMSELARQTGLIIQAHHYLEQCHLLYVEFVPLLAESVAILLADLKARFGPALSLPTRVQTYLTIAGFAVTLSSEPTLFIATPIHPSWQSSIKQAVVVKVLTGATLQRHAVMRIVDDAQRLLGRQLHCIFVICDHTPSESAWLQIATLRADGINVIPIFDSIMADGEQKNQHLVVLRDYLESRFLSPQRDLYNITTPISDQLNFFGREKLADQFVEDLAQSHVALFGLRKMGKSSLLNYVRNRLSYPAAVIDLQAGTDLRQVYARIVAAWMARLRTLQPSLNWQAPELAADETPSTHFSRTVRELLGTLTDSEATTQLGIFIDEIELIYPYTESKLNTYLDFARTLRGLAQEHLGKICLIVAGVDPNLIRTNRLFGQQNPFYNFFRIQYLPPLSYDDCRQMIRNIGVQMGLLYEDDAIDLVAKVSGGHPYWARKLCSLAFQAWKKQGGSGPITRLHLSTIIHLFIRHPDTAQLLGGLWVDVTDRYLWAEDDAAANAAILLALAETDQSTRTDLLTQTGKPAACQRSLFELDARAIIDEVADDTFWIHLQLFRNWIRTDKLGKE